MTPPDQPDFREGVPFLGGALWIDLLNTTPVIGGQSMDLIGGVGALQTWARLAGLARGESPSPTDVADTQSLRAALRPAFDDLAKGLAVPTAAVQAVNAALRGVTVTRRLEGGRLVEEEIVHTGPVAAAAALNFALFLAEHEAGRMRHCSNPSCTMVFYDRGKNNRRRWCSMQACGNRAKVTSYRERKAAREGA
jgi:predicted RNA-binding Zn ribbon-like protein